MKIPLFGQTGEELHADASAQRTVNWYPHLSNETKSKMMMYPTPSITSIVTLGTGTTRGMLEYGEELFMVNGSGFYKVDESNVSTLLGTMDTFTGRVGMAHNGSNNGQQIIIVDGSFGYIYNEKYGTFSKIKQFASGNADTNLTNQLKNVGETFVTKGVVSGTVVYNTTAGTKGVVSNVVDEETLDIVTLAGVALDLFPLGTEAYEVGTDNFPTTATNIEFMDSFFLADDPTNSGRIYKSQGYSGTDWDALDFATAEKSPDELARHIVSNQILYMVGARTTEKWYNAGGSGFPFLPIQSGFSQWGTIAANSVVDVSGTILYLAQNDEGVGQVVSISSTGAPKMVSTSSIAAEITKITSLSSAYAWTYQYHNHTFYVLTFPVDGKTFVYDLSTNLWHEWSVASTKYHKGSHHLFVYGKHYVGDNTDNNLYTLSWDTFTDDGEAIHRFRRSANITSQTGDTQLRHHAVQLDIKEGVTTLSGNGVIYSNTSNGYSTTLLVGAVVVEGAIVDGVINSSNTSNVKVGDTITLDNTPSVSGIVTGFSGSGVTFDKGTWTETHLEEAGGAPFTITRASLSSVSAQLRLRWKDDNGSWSNYHSRDMGKTGEVHTELVWRRLGRTSDRVYEISTSDPVSCVLIDSWAKLTEDSGEIK